MGQLCGHARATGRFSDRAGSISAFAKRSPTSGGIANCTTIMKIKSVLISRAGGRQVSRFGCRNSSHVTIAATDTAGRYVLTISGMPAACSTAYNANAPAIVAG
jgi:hypothetical protein